MSTKPHMIGSVVNELTMIGTVSGGFFRVGSASGPLEPSFIDYGPVVKGSRFYLGYNYATGEYVNQTGGWHVEAVRINAKTVTVREVDGDKQTYRIEFL